MGFFVFTIVKVASELSLSFNIYLYIVIKPKQTNLPRVHRMDLQKEYVHGSDSVSRSFFTEVSKFVLLNYSFKNAHLI